MSNKSLLKLSENANPNYVAAICRITNTGPIPGSDRLMKTVIDGYDIVINKDMRVGQMVLYFPIESKICDRFLKANNLYSPENYELNSNASEIAELRAEINNLESDLEADQRNVDIQLLINEKLKEIKAKCGFFDKTGRVRMIRLRGQYSMGFVMPIESLLYAYPELTAHEILEVTEKGDFHFDTVVTNDGEDRIVCKYDPLTDSKKPTKRSLWNRITHSDNVIPGFFNFHYDTKQLERSISDLNPLDNVTVTVKLHGVSAIFGRIPMYNDMSFKEMFNHYILRKPRTISMRPIVASRTVIKNRYSKNWIGKLFNEPEISEDAHTFMFKRIQNIIKPHMTVYGELVGYWGEKIMQKKHDYGCNPGQLRFMPYRVVDEKGEWTVEEVISWSKVLENEGYPIKPMTLLYSGRFSSRYPDIPLDENFGKNALAEMKNDFGLEKDEPLCTNNIVPREGIVIRKVGDKIARAWKLKSKRHTEAETSARDHGEVDAEEMA